MPSKTKKIKNSTITFRHLRKTFTGQVQEWSPTRDKPMVRVSVDTGDPMKPQVFIFYRTAPDELFWYDHPKDDLQQMAWKIVNTLLS